MANISRASRFKAAAFKMTTLAMIVSLTACGGGGGGYYGNFSNSSSTSTSSSTSSTAKAATNYHIVMSSNKPTMVITGDTAIVTVKLVDVNGGGVAGEKVTLSITDTATNGVTIDGASSAATDATGNVSFTLKLVNSTITDKASLLSKGIRLNALFTDTTGKATAQTMLINAVESLSSSTSTAQYHLMMSTNKPTLVVTGDNAIVTIKAVDANGGGVSGQTVVLSIPDTLTNGVTINGASSDVTDATGNVSFTILLPAKASAAVQSTLLANGVTVNAALTDANGVTTKQSTLMNVVPTPVAEPIGNITFGNSGILATSNDGVYYIESLSANLVDIDGKPITYQPVTMSINMVGIGKGFYTITKDSTGKVTRIPTACSIQPAPVGTAIATTFVAPSSSSDGTVTYTTDGTGKFDFQVRYLRKYATWQTVRFNAQATVSGKTIQSSLDFPLTVLKADFDSEAGQPFDTSPYGTSCP